LTSLKALLKKIYAYNRAYTHVILWPLVLLQRNPVYDKLAEIAARNAPGGWVLDVGTGPGHLPVRTAIKDPTVRAVGVDILPELISDGVNRAGHKKVDGRVFFVEARAECLPFGNSSFDVVQTVMSMHQWTDWRQGMSELARVLKPGGQAQMLVSRRFLVHGLARVFGLSGKESLTVIKTQCESAGFSRVELKDDFGILWVTAWK
jgi:SAM-dependent methyltransferase